MLSLSKPRLRQIWFQLHKWLGLTLALLVIPISLTGAALMWHDALDEALNPERRTEAKPALNSSAYATAARRAAPDETLVSLRFPEESGAVVATLARPHPGEGRPVRTILHLDPADARILDRSASNEGLVHVMHVLHGSLMVPGLGRQIVGWVGVAMLLSSLTGLWLWWPLTGSLRRGLRWRRQPATSGNLHHQAGFWVALLLAILSASGVWISFPAAFAQVSGETPPRRPPPATPLAATRLTPDQALAAANGGPATFITWPTERSREWKLTFGRAEASVDDATGIAAPPEPPGSETTARLMRRIHDGTGLPLAWQIVIFIGGILPALLAVTGIMMWLNVRRRRRAMSGRRSARLPELDAPATAS